MDSFLWYDGESVGSYVPSHFGFSYKVNRLPTQHQVATCRDTFMICHNVIEERDVRNDRPHRTIQPKVLNENGLVLHHIGSGVANNDWIARSGYLGPMTSLRVELSRFGPRQRMPSG